MGGPCIVSTISFKYDPVVMVEFVCNVPGAGGNKAGPSQGRRASTFGGPPCCAVIKKGRCAMLSNISSVSRQCPARHSDRNVYVRAVRARWCIDVK